MSTEKVRERQKNAFPYFFRTHFFGFIKTGYLILPRILNTLMHLTIMKQFFKLQLALLTALFCFLPSQVKAQAETETETPTYIVNALLQQKISWGENDDNNTDKGGYRSPSRPIPIYISEEDGVQIPQVNKNDIISYAIYDENEVCLATFTNEADFVDFVFSSTDTVKVRVELEDYYLCGWLQRD